jgi:hypothetical protein
MIALVRKKPNRTMNSRVLFEAVTPLIQTPPQLLPVSIIQG